MFSFLYFGQNRILKKLLNYCENIKKILSSHKNMKKHSQMVLQYNVSKVNELATIKHLLKFFVQHIFTNTTFTVKRKTK